MKLKIFGNLVFSVLLGLLWYWWVTHADTIREFLPLFVSICGMLILATYMEHRKDHTWTVILGLASILWIVINLFIIRNIVTVLCGGFCVAAFLLFYFFFALADFIKQFFPKKELSKS